MSRTPMFEQLEPRQLLSGNVIVQLDGDAVRFIGDSQANGMFTSYDGTFIAIIPDATTSVNGNAPGFGFFYQPNVPLRKLNLNMGGGNDTLFVGIDDFTGATVPTTLTAMLSINMGAGDDALVVAGVTTPVLNVADTLGNNTITIGSGLLVGGSNFTASTIGSTLQVTTGAGNDTINIAGVDITGKLKLFPGNGNNTATVDGGGGVNTTISIDLEYRGGIGNDTLFIGSPTPLVGNGTVSLGRDALIGMGRGASSVLTVNPLASLLVGRKFTAHSTAAASNFTLDTISADHGYNLAVGGLNNIVSLLNMDSASGGIVLAEKGTATNLLVVHDVTLILIPNGKFTANMTGKVSNTVIATNWISIRIFVTGAKGAANNANLVNVLGALGPLVFTNFIVVGAVSSPRLRFATAA